MNMCVSLLKFVQGRKKKRTSFFLENIIFQIVSSQNRLLVSHLILFSARNSKLSFFYARSAPWNSRMATQIFLLLTASSGEVSLSRLLDRGIDSIGNIDAFLHTEFNAVACCRQVEKETREVFPSFLPSPLPLPRGGRGSLTEA